MTLFDKNAQYSEAIKIFENYPNDSEAQYYLGKAYYYGMGVEKNLTKAFGYASLSAGQNNSKGLNLLGVLYQYGEGVELNELMALKFYEQSANLGNVKAMVNITQLYFTGRKINKNTINAIAWLEKAFNLGYPEAARLLGIYYASEEGENNIDKAVHYFDYFFVHSDDKLMLGDTYERLGFIYEEQNNYDNAYVSYKKAADLKFYSRTYKLYGYAFEKGISDKKEEALQYLQIAADNNDSMATQTLVMHYIKNTKEIQKAIDVLKKSYYEFGDIQSGCDLADNLARGSFNLDGIDCKKIYNPEKSLQIINDIINKYPFHEKIESCYTTLAYMYRQGYYLEEDLDKAFKIYEQIKNNYHAEYLQEFVSKEIDEIKIQIEEDKSFTDDLKNTTIKDENNLFTYIDNVSKENQVVAILNSENYYFLSTSDKSIKVINKKSLKVTQELRGYTANGADGLVTTMAFDEKNKLLYCAGINNTINYILNDIIKVYNVETGKIIKTILNKKSLKNTFLNISEDGEYLVAINNNNLINIININTNEIQNFHLQNIGDFIFANIEKTSTDYLIHLVSKNYQHVTISHTQGKIISEEPFLNQIDIKSKTYISKSDGDKIMSAFKSFIPIDKIGINDKELKIDLQNTGIFSFDMDSLNIMKSSSLDELKTETKNITVKYLDNGSTLEIFKDNKKIGLINVGTMKINYHKIIDNKYIFVENSDSTTQCFFDLTGNPLLFLEGVLYSQKELITNNKFFVTYGEDNIIHIWDKKALLNSKYNKGIYDKNVLNMLSYLAGGDPTEMIQEKYSDEDLQNMQRSMRIDYKLSSEKLKAFFNFFMTQKDSIEPLASLYIKNEKDWIIYTPEGVFSYAGEGDKLLKYHQNQGLYKEAKIIENEKLFDKFYRPDLIKNILAGKQVEIPMDVKSVILNIKPPKLSIIGNKMVNQKDVSLTYKVCDEGNGVSDSKLIINGQAINPPTSRGFSNIPLKENEQNCNIYKSTHTLDSGQNTIYVKSYDNDKYIASESEHLTIVTSFNTDKKSNLYFLSIAVSDNKDDSFKLKYPVKDSEAVKEQINLKSKNIYENIYTFSLNNNEVTKENIDKIFNQLKDKIEKNDAFILYVAGHGMTIDGKYQFIAYNPSEKISIDFIKTNLSKIDVTKSLILLDTCQSGAIFDNLIDETATINRLSHDDNRNYIVASSKDQVALEGYKNHGVFSYGVIDAFLNNRKLKVWGLADHVSEVVPKITKEKFRFEQRPQAKLNTNFILVEGND